MNLKTTLTCPRCHSASLRRSRTRGFRERLLKHLGWRAVRCREKTCRWRGLVKMEAPFTALWVRIKSQKINFLVLAVALCAIGLLTITLLYFIR